MYCLMIKQRRWHCLVERTGEGLFVLSSSLNRGGGCLYCLVHRTGKVAVCIAKYIEQGDSCLYCLVRRTGEMSVSFAVSIEQRKGLFCIVYLMEQVRWLFALPS